MSILTALNGHGLRADSDRSVIVGGEATSWEHLAARADALGAQLLGAPAVAVPGTAKLDTIIAVAACMRWGIPIVPVPDDAGPMEREHILRDSGATVVLGSPDWPEAALHRLTVPTNAMRSVSHVAPVVDVADTAIIMYTSGTTGLPKGVMISHRAIAADLDALAAAWAWTPDDTLAHGLPLFHVHGLILGILGALRVGSRVVHTGKPTPERYAEAAHNLGATMFFGVPTVWSRVVADSSAAAALAPSRLLVSGSAPLPVAVFEQMQATIGQVPVERYGMTETLITLSTRADGERRPGCVGTPLARIQTRLRDDDGNALPHDGETIGGLEVTGPTLCTGYLNRPDATAESTTADGWFITGDSVVIDGDGFHRVVGRSSIDIIKTGGYKVGAGEVEAALLTHASVTEAAVIGVPDDDLGERVVAVVVGAGCDSATLISHVASLLSVHKRPREIRIVSELPRNAMGKVQKKLLH
ncbi:MAG TPA: AMP-binding protein [Ilumatobacter sp.]|nr:AMP-binding protein [Ilumatobacter sp.]